MYTTDVEEICGKYEGVCTENMKEYEEICRTLTNFFLGFGTLKNSKLRQRDSKNSEISLSIEAMNLERYKLSLPFYFMCYSSSGLLHIGSGT